MKPGLWARLLSKAKSKVTTFLPNAFRRNISFHYFCQKVRNKCILLTLIWVSFLGVRFEVFMCVGGIHPRLKLVRSMLDTSNLARKYRHTCTFKNIPFSTKAFLILMMSAYFKKKSVFLAKILHLLKAIVWELCYRFFSFVFSFCKIAERLLLIKI